MNKLVEALKNEKGIEAPEWSVFVKTGAHKEMPPAREDWWHVRLASLLRKVNKYGPVGTNKLAKFYGGRKNRGVRPDRKVTGSRKIIRVGLQQLESAGLIKQVEKPSSGKVLTKEGAEFMRNNKE